MRNRHDGENGAARRFAPALLAACLAMPLAARAHGQLVDVAAAFDHIPAAATALSFDRGAFELPRGGHMQGMQLRRDAHSGESFVFISHDSATVAYLAVVAFPADLASPGRIVHVLTFPSDGALPPLRHAGGIQLVGDILAVGVEDNQQKTRSEIQFWNVAQPSQPRQLAHLTIRRSGLPEDKTAGAVGVVKRADDYLVAVGNWDSRAIDFYASSGPQLDNPECRFEFQVRWRADAADRQSWQPDKQFGAYQALNLVAQPDRKLFLVAPQTSGSADLVDLYAIDMLAAPEALLEKRASRPVRLPGGNHFRNAGGAWISQDGLALLSSPRNFAPQTSIGLAGQRVVAKP